MDLIPTLRMLTRQATRCDDTVSVPVLVLLEAIGALERHDLGPVYARLRREVRAVEAEMERRFDENRAQVAELFQSQHREFGEYLNDLHRRVFPFETKPIAFDAYDPDRPVEISGELPHHDTAGADTPTASGGSGAAILNAPTTDPS